MSLALLTGYCVTVFCLCNKYSMHILIDYYINYIYSYHCTLHLYTYTACNNHNHNKHDHAFFCCFKYVSNLVAQS